MNKINSLHLLLTHAEQFVIGLSNNSNNFDMPISQFFVTPFFKILGNLVWTENGNRALEADINFTHEIHKNLLTICICKCLHIKIQKATTFGIRKGFLAAYSHSFTIFLSFGWPSCKIRVKGKVKTLGCSPADYTSMQFQIHLIVRLCTRLNSKCMFMYLLLKVISYL